MGEPDGVDDLRITLFPAMDIIVIRKSPNSKLFISTQESILINKEVLYQIIRAMVLNNLFDPEVLEGMLEEAIGGKDV
jgi:hypothetical protein